MEDLTRLKERMNVAKPDDPVAEGRMHKNRAIEALARFAAEKDRVQGPIARENVRKGIVALVSIVERVTGERDAARDLAQVAGECIATVGDDGKIGCPHPATHCQDHALNYLLQRDAAIRERDEAREWAEKSVREVEARERIMTCSCTCALAMYDADRRFMGCTVPGCGGCMICVRG